jgi:hypothetical protein
VGIFHRKSKWGKLSNQMVKRSGRLANGAVHNSSVKTGAVAATGIVALTAASAALSALRRKANT